MEHYNKKPPLRCEHIVFMCEDIENLSISARVYSKQPSKEALIRQRLNTLYVLQYDAMREGNHEVADFLSEVIYFLKLLL